MVLLLSDYGFGVVYCKVKGRVVDEETGAGIPDVNVQLHRFIHDSPQDAYVLTDKEGYFSFSNLKPGKYVLNYIPLFPHVLDPQKRSDWTDHKRAFIIAEGEIKNFVRRLKKGGRLIVDFNSTILDVSRCGLKCQFLDRIEGEELVYDIETLSNRWRHPKFKKSQEGDVYSGLSEGQYITSFQLFPLGDYFHEVDYDIVGIPKILTITKKQDTKLNIAFNSKSTLILDIFGENNIEIDDGNFNIYRKITISSKEVFYKVFSNTFTKVSEIKPLSIMPGDYVVSIVVYPLPLQGQDKYSVVPSQINYFKFSIQENMANNLKCKILFSGNDLVDVSFIHF